MLTIQQTLTKRRIDLCLSQTELAEMIGVQQSVVSQWEAGLVQPRLNSLLRWTCALSVTFVLVPSEWL